MDLAAKEKLGPVQEVTDFSAGINHRKLEIRNNTKRIAQEDAAHETAARLEATKDDSRIGAEEVARKAKMLKLAADNPSCNWPTGEGEPLQLSSIPSWQTQTTPMADSNNPHC